MADAMNLRTTLPSSGGRGLGDGECFMYFTNNHTVGCDYWFFFGNDVSRNFILFIGFFNNLAASMVKFLV